MLRVREEPREKEPVGRSKLYKSLINLPSKRTVDIHNNNQRNHRSREGKLAKFKKWRELPPEVISRILSMLNSETDQQTLVECLLVNHMFYHTAKGVLYSRPHFTSTYRIAQFVTCLRQCEENGLLVRKLDLSQLRSGELTALGGSWRDWQARYAATRKYGHKPSVSVGSLENYFTNDNNNYCYSYARDHRSNSNLSNSSSHSGGNSSSGSSNSSGESNNLGETQGKWTSLWTKFKKSGQKNKTNTASIISRPTNRKKSASVTTVPATSNADTTKSGQQQTTTTKYLAPYASYKDLPLGHLLHLLRLCKNITDVDLSNLILSADFELPSSSQPQLRSMVPGASVEPRAMYLSDSTKPWDIRNSGYGNGHLRKLHPDMVFEVLLERPTIHQLRMDNIVWVRQSIVSNYVLQAFISGRENQVLSFNRSGLHRHLAWTCQASICDLVALVIMDRIVSSDDLALQELFPTMTQLHPDILEVSQVFPIELPQNGISSNFKVRLTILKTSGITSHHLRKLCSQYLSLVVLLEDGSTATSQLNVVERRIVKRAKTTLRRLRELRNIDLRRALGQNYLIPVTHEN